MNEGDPSYLRARASRYRRLAEGIENTETKRSLSELAGRMEGDAERNEDEHAKPHDRPDGG